MTTKNSNVIKVTAVFSYLQDKNGEFIIDHMNKSLKNFMYIDTSFTINREVNSEILGKINEAKHLVYKAQLQKFAETYGGFFKLEKTRKINRIKQLDNRVVIPVVLNVEIDPTIDDEVTAIDFATNVSYKILGVKICNAKESDPSKWETVKIGEKNSNDVFNPVLSEMKTN